MAIQQSDPADRINNSARPSSVLELTVTAVTENLPRVAAFVDDVLEAMGCLPKTQLQIDLAVEEIYVNIARYAYAPDTGEARVRLETFDDPASVRITFFDQGVPYDPLSRSDPDTSLSAEERGIGGLGVYLTKKLMDAVTYAHEDGQNVLTLQKKL